MSDALKEAIWMRTSPETQVTILREYPGLTIRVRIDVSKPDGGYVIHERTICLSASQSADLRNALRRFVP